MSRVQRLASRVQLPKSSFQSPASTVRHPESSVQSPESNLQSPASRVQRPESRVQFLRPGSRNSGMPMKTEFRLSLRIECSKRYTEWKFCSQAKETLWIFEINTNELCIKLCCLWMFYILPDLNYFTCDIIIKREVDFIERWKQTIPI